jgi:hypothetical protein
MFLLLIAIIVTALFQFTVRRRVGLWDLTPRSAPLARAMALATLILWFAIAVAGRWIAYMVLDYG